jgi:mannosyl-oligosaccharide alpha-1,2-mannosidase
MRFSLRRLLQLLVALVAVFFLVPLVYRQCLGVILQSKAPRSREIQIPPSPITQSINWKDIPQRYPVTSTIALPSGTSVPRPRIQHEFGVETEHNKAQRLQRQAAVKDAYIHSWEGYKKYAWKQDELLPVSAGFRNTLGARGATLIDSLTTLLIMGMGDEFTNALKEVREIDFSTSAEPILNLFETNIRYLGGLLGAYDLSEKKHRVLLQKAAQLGDMLYGAFDTPNRLPVTRWDWQRALHLKHQHALQSAFSAELGTLTLEFTRLSQLTGDHKYYDAVQRISDIFSAQQNKTSIPGLFPITISPATEDFTYANTYSLGGCADSLYEYFIKEHMLLGGVNSQYRNLYENSIDAAKEHLFFRPLNPENKDILIPGTARKGAVDRVKLDPEGQHLACFVGGMVALGAQVLGRSDDLVTARKLVDGCIWASDATPTGIMPEMFHLVPCADPDDCAWNMERWHQGVKAESGSGRDADIPDIIQEDGLRPGFTKIADKRFLLRYAPSSKSPVLH